MNRVDVQTPRRPTAPRPRRKSDGTRPFSYFELLLAGRYLRARRQEGWISVVTIFSMLGIMLGVATLIIVMSVMNGFRAEIMAKILGFRGHYMIQSAGGTLENWESIAARLSKVEGVTRATPFVEGQALATGGGMSPGVVVRGVRSADILKIRLVADSLKPGVLQRFQADNDSVLVGESLANNMGLQQGMDITLLAPRGNVTPFGVTPRQKKYRIAGTFKVGMSLYDANMIFMPMQEAQEYFNKGRGASGIEVMVAKPDQVDAMRGTIERIAPDTTIYDWRHTDPDFFSALEVERTVMFFILTMIIIVAGFNIISGMIMLVKDKTRDIAILRTMGAARGTILRVFLMSGSVIGIAGTFAGWILGVVFCWNIENIRQFLIWITGVNLFPETLYFLSKLPAKMDTGEIAAVVALSLTLTMLATIYPAWRAARLDPVEALRYE
ncbi:MAG: lipoprotein-releasing ABC transporter permease subunit [Micropepsaceae bacterium]